MEKRGDDQKTQLESTFSSNNRVVSKLLVLGNINSDNSLALTQMLEADTHFGRELSADFLCGYRCSVQLKLKFKDTIPCQL